MSDNGQPNLWDAVAKECPRKIMRLLHEAGHYHHGVSPTYPGKILCSHRDTDLPDGWEPTEAQELADYGIPGASSGNQ